MSGLDCKTVVACVAGAKRGGGREKSTKEGKGKVPSPLSPTPLTFSLSPYPLPLSTPATQAKQSVFCVFKYSGTPPDDHHFFVARTKTHSFSYLKTPLIRPPRSYDQRPPLGVLSRYFLYKITPLIRPVKMLGGAAE